MVKVNWSPENDRKLLLQLMTTATKDIPIEYITNLFPGATQKSITERIAKLRREKKAYTGTGSTPTSTPVKPGSNRKPTTTPSQHSAKDVTDPSWTGGSQTPGVTSDPTKGAVLGAVLGAENAPRGRKRGAVKVEDEDESKSRKRRGVKHEVVDLEEEAEDEPKKIMVEIDDDDEVDDDEDEELEVKDESLSDGA